MAKLKYEVICGVTDKLITDGADQPRMHYYSKNKGNTTTWLHLDKNEPEVAELIKQKEDAEKGLWNLHNQSPTAFPNRNKDTNVEAEVSNEVVEEAMEEVAPY